MRQQRFSPEIPMHQEDRMTVSPRRAHDGNASNPERAKQMAQAIPVLARMANELG